MMNKKLNHLGINVGKRKCRAALKDDRGKILDKFFFGNDVNGISNLLSRVKTNETRSTTTTVATQAVLESTGNMWMIIHDTLEENGIDTVPKQEDRDKQSLNRHKITLSRTKTRLVNKVHLILDKYNYKTDLTDIFGVSGIQWLKSLLPKVSPVDRIILSTSIECIQTINHQIDTVSKEISTYACRNSTDIKILLSIT